MRVPMSKIWKRGLTGLAALVVILAAGFAWLVYMLGHAQLPPPLAQLSGLEVKRQDGSPARLGSDLRAGVPTLVVMWASWCVPCRAEMPGIQNLYAKMDHEKVAFIMLSIDKDDDKGKIVDYLQKREFTFKAYQPAGYLPGQLRIPSIPTTFIISKEGKIVRKEVGSKSYDTSKYKKFLDGLSQ